METKIWHATLALAILLSGCGGGSGSVSVDGEPAPVLHPFIVWAGSSGGDQVIDANGNAFAFYADSGCLYNFRTGQENRQFCLTSGQGTVQYGGLAMRVVNVRSATGSCAAALVEESTANFVDIEIDSLGREVVFVTAARPFSCF